MNFYDWFITAQVFIGVFMIVYFGLLLWDGDKP